MRPLKHVLFGAIFSVLIFLIFPQIKLLWLLILFFSTFMIDFDHFIYYAYRKKSLNLFKSFSWYLKNRAKFCSLPMEEKRKIYGGLFIFHGMEFLTVLFLVGIFLYKPFIINILTP